VSSIAVTEYSARPGWLVGRNFDTTLIVGVGLLSLGVGGFSWYYPALFGPLLIADLWFLGYHHVIATFTRLAFDAESFRQYKFLVVWLPLFVVIAVVAVVLALGPWILATTYLYWQWWHYTRQAYGISRIYQVKGNPQSKSGIDEYIMYLLPVTGILFRSCQNPGTFLGMELRVLPVSQTVVEAAFALTLTGVMYWLFRQYKSYQAGTLTWGYFLFGLSHFFIFTVGYMIIPDINIGWLVVKVGHNAQYILFVWMYNNKRFKDGVDPDHRFLSTLCQRKNQWAYYLVCIILSTILFFTLDRWLTLLEPILPFKISTFPLILILFQTINFHHYIVDAIIWQVRKKPLRQTLEIA